MQGYFFHMTVWENVERECEQKQGDRVQEGDRQNGLRVV